MASFAGLDRCSEVVKGHAAASLVKSFLDGLPQQVRDERVTAMLDEAAAQMREGFAQSPLSLAAVRALAQRPMALGMGRLTIQGMLPSLALVVDEGDAGKQIDAVLDQLVAARPEPTRIKPGTAAGLACRLVEGDEMPTLIAVHDDGIFVLTNSEPYLREILATRRGEKPSLAASTPLCAQRARLLEVPLVEAFVNAAPMLPMFEPLLPYEAAEFGRALGIESIGGAYLAAGPSGQGTVETLDVALGGASDGLLKAALSGQVDFGAARFFGKDTLAFAAVRVDANAAAAAFDRFCDQLPRQWARDVRRDAERDFLRGFRMAGFEDREVAELFAAIDGSVSIGLLIDDSTAGIPEGLAVAKLRDVAVVAKQLARLRAAMGEQGMEWKLRQSGDVDVHYCSAPIGGPGGPQLSPSYAIVDGRLLVGSSTRAILSALKLRADGAETLASEADFAAAALADEGSMAFVHLRPGRMCETQWKLAETWLLPQIDANEMELGFSSEDLPEPEALAKALGTITMSITCDAQGMRIRTRGNVGLGGAAASSFALVHEVMQRATAKAN